MRTTIDAAGRLVIPEEIHRQAGLKPGMSLDVTWREGRIEIEPTVAQVRLVRKGRFLVAVPETDLGVLTPEMVEATREALMNERSFGV